ncbi:MAG: hypothetical protein HYY24_13790 [Verrucomicrobia bacterium]|nr:hypothetical protein [Verrucomicrobiota bacterium]
MNAADILQALSQRPFKPFRLTLSTAREILVEQHDTVLINESRTTLLALEGDRWHIVDLPHIVQLTFRSQPTAEELAR